MAERQNDSRNAPESLPRDDPETERAGVSPLLRLEPSTTENTGENPAATADSNPPDLLDPLLGTSLQIHPIRGIGDLKAQLRR